MRTSLIIFGIVFLVIGGLLYFMPMQQIEADTITTEGSNVDTRTSSAMVTVPIAWAYALLIIGFILLILGFAVSDIIVRDSSKKDSYDKVVESRENVKVGNGDKRKIILKRTEQHKSRRDED
ncbi:MAG: hypothetical protein Q7S27_04485 [Nanoarchaeota archaeon]|nr:hypothetical protein [Nanoarchaeota archaeon]